MKGNKMSIDKLKRQRRICLAVCFPLIFVTVLMVKRFGGGMVVLFFVMMLITVQIDRSGEVEMVVPPDVYLAVTEGKRGLLKHKGKQFHSFT